MMKKVLKILAAFLGVVALLAVGLVLFLTVTEYKPAPRQAADRLIVGGEEHVGMQLTLYSWNIGYAGLGKESDFFMDGGKMVDPPGEDVVRKNMEGIRGFIANTPADAWLVQEVDVNASRTGGMDQFSLLHNTVSASAAFAYNYKCPFVPIPVPPMGRIESGLVTLSGTVMNENAERISLPCPFSWPVRAANIKRCLLVTRLPVADSEKELVLINLHLEAYESGEGRIAQTKLLMDVMEEEYAKGNFVIAGGDFNQSFPGTRERYPIKDAEKWTPGILEEDSLPEGWQFAFDEENPTCRLLDQPYCEDCQLFVIDGFILSPNVTLDEVETVQLDFEYTDHNPVRLAVTLGK